MTLREYLRECRLAYLQAVLEECGGKVTKAAKIAGIHRGSFYRIIPRPKGNAAWRALADTPEPLGRR